jgi:predicted CxxxxCH...CXXCH cytochrome family protein
VWNVAKKKELTMGKNRASRRRYSLVVAGIAALVSLIFGAGAAEAVSFLNSCTTFCHGTPQRDAARKGNPHFGSQSSAFLGNHKNHLSAAPSTNDCSICHAPVAATNFGHQNNTIEMALKLKGYSTSTGRARYDKGVFFNQTSIPVLTNATCSNVNCHFEKKTPVWGSAAFNVATDCNACHGAPPAGTTVAPAGGLAGSHTRHDAYFPGTANCQKCHPNSTTFTHATSAGRALKVQGFLRDPLNTLEATGAYSGTGVNYLPSKSASPAFGTCGNIYCHSSGQSATGAGAGTTVTTPAWGGAPLACGSCHVDMSSNASATGSHAAHAQSSGTVYTCDTCHGTGFSATTVNVATHVNKQINLAFTGNAGGTTYVTKGAAFTPGSAAYSTCTTSNCHGAMNPTWGANTAKARCLKCHGYRSTGWNALNGATATTDTKAGAHFNHISSAGALKYAKPFSCVECHATTIALSTDNVNTAGHFDTAGPAEVSFGALAKTNANTPTYSAAACATNYCHGSNMASNVSNPPASRTASPTWNAPFLGTASVVGNGSTTPGSGDCSKCHGYPPMTVTHVGKIATACSGCHSHVNASGTGFTDASKHINGVVDAAGGDCNSCHDFDTVGATYAASKWSGGTWGKLNLGNYATANEGWGAHAQHINFIKTRLGIAVALTASGQSFGVGQSANVCGTCHTNSGTHNMSATGGADPTGRSINFGDGTFRYGGTAGTSFLLGASNPVYNGVSGTSSSSVPKTCSNISCHYFTTPLWSTY